MMQDAALRVGVDWPPVPPPLCPSEHAQMRWCICGCPRGCHIEHHGKRGQRPAADNQCPVILPGLPLGWVSILPALPLAPVIIVNVEVEDLAGDGIVQVA